MLTNELRSGDYIRLANGWTATLMDNKRGQTRLAEVNGLVVECGSVYSHDIVARLNADGTETAIEYTEQQNKLRIRVKQIFDYVGSA